MISELFSLGGDEIHDRFHPRREQIRPFHIMISLCDRNKSINEGSLEAGSRNDRVTQTAHNQYVTFVHKWFMIIGFLILQRVRATHIMPLDHPFLPFAIHEKLTLIKI